MAPANCKSIESEYPTVAATELIQIFLDTELFFWPSDISASSIKVSETSELKLANSLRATSTGLIQKDQTKAR